MLEIGTDLDMFKKQKEEEIEVKMTGKKKHITEVANNLINYMVMAEMNDRL